MFQLVHKNFLKSTLFVHLFSSFNSQEVRLYLGNSFALAVVKSSCLSFFRMQTIRLLADFSSDNKRLTLESDQFCNQKDENSHLFLLKRLLWFDRLLQIILHGQQLLPRSLPTLALLSLIQLSSFNPLIRRQVSL